MIYAKKRECFRQKDLILLLSLLLNFIRVLDLAKTAPQEAVTDEVSLLLAIKVRSGKDDRKYRLHSIGHLAYNICCQGLSDSWCA